MIFKFTLLSNLLLASAALAVPSSRIGDRRARRDNIRQSQPLSRVASSASPIPVIGTPNWGGLALIDSNNGTFNMVVATFTVPTITGNDGAASIWVGIDGAPACHQVICQTGIDFTITQGQVQYGAWYEWYPAASMPFQDFDVRPGDVITATVVVDNTTSGMAFLENQNTKQSVSQHLQGDSSTALCESSAEWIVEDFGVNGNLVSFANFSSVTFTGAYAFGPGVKMYRPSDPHAYIIDITNGTGTGDHTAFTYVTVDGDNDITIQYIDGFNPQS